MSSQVGAWFSLGN